MEPTKLKKEVKKTSEPSEEAKATDPEQTKQFEADIEFVPGFNPFRLISKLEYFCAGFKFTEPINKFISDHAVHFDVVEEEKGHPHEYYILYTQYMKLIDGLLEGSNIVTYRHRVCEGK